MDFKRVEKTKMLEKAEVNGYNPKFLVRRVIIKKVKTLFKPEIKVVKPVEVEPEIIQEVEAGNIITGYI